ncbi:MAG: Asp23/Gls24 family envelope stress response protein, partial [Ktedonobacterales bacterium]|nr:Asp23/Gls24 family envelope stress response protein [Ktedonobacterales bacterium]
MPMLGWGRARGTTRAQTAPPQTAAAHTPPLPPNAIASSLGRGRIEVSERAIATIAGRAVAECYGVVGIAARHPRLGIVQPLAPEYYGR